MEPAQLLKLAGWIVAFTGGGLAAVAWLTPGLQLGTAMLGGALAVTGWILWQAGE